MQVKNTKIAAKNVTDYFKVGRVRKGVNLWDRIIAGIWQRFSFFRGSRKTRHPRSENPNIKFKLIFGSRLSCTPVIFYYFKLFRAYIAAAVTAVASRN